MKKMFSQSVFNQFITFKTQILFNKIAISMLCKAIRTSNGLWYQRHIFNEYITMYMSYILDITDIRFANRRLARSETWNSLNCKTQQLRKQMHRCKARLRGLAKWLVVENRSICDSKTLKRISMLNKTNYENKLWRLFRNERMLPFASCRRTAIDFASRSREAAFVARNPLWVVQCLFVECVDVKCWFDKEGRVR